MPGGIIVSETEPEKTNRYVWMKPLPDGSEEWYTLDGGDAWILYRTVPARALAGHTHTSLGNIDFTGLIKVAGVEGLTGSRLIPAVGTLTFTKGILTGFSPV